MVLGIRCCDQFGASGKKASIVGLPLQSLVLSPEDGMYGGFDISSDHFSRGYTLCSTPHAPRALVYLVPMLIVQIAC